MRAINARREATGDQGIGSAVERDILDRELAELDEFAVAQSAKPVTDTLTFTFYCQARRTDARARARALLP